MTGSPCLSYIRCNFGLDQIDIDSKTRTRTTVNPWLAASTAASIISIWALSTFPGTLLAMRTETCFGIKASIVWGTSLSERTRSAHWVSAVWVAMVRREGCPGPEPTKRIRPSFFCKEDDWDWEELACGRTSIGVFEGIYYKRTRD